MLGFVLVLVLVLGLVLGSKGLTMHKYDALPSQRSSSTPWQLARGKGDGCVRVRRDGEGWG